MAQGSGSRSGGQPGGSGRGSNTRQSGGRSVAQQSRGSSQSAGSSIAARTASWSPSQSAARPTTVVVDRALEHVLKIIGFDRTTQPDHPVLDALRHASYTSLTDLFAHCCVDVKALTYIDTTVQPPIRMMGNQTRLLAPQGFCEYNKNKFQREMNTSDWIFTTEDNINQYLLSSDYMYFNNSNGTSTVPGTAPGVTKPNSSIEAFKKSMKWEPSSQFKKNFSDKRYWATWHLQFVATAQAQDLDDIIDPNYVPTMQDDKDLFTLKQKYLFSIFATILQTDEGKALVRNQQQLRVLTPAGNSSQPTTDLNSHFISAKVFHIWTCDPTRQVVCNRFRTWDAWTSAFLLPSL
jgi:hypothetical protein